MTRKRPPAEERNPTERLGDLEPREETPEKAAAIKGGLEPPHGIRLTALPPNDPPDG